MSAKGDLNVESANDYLARHKFKSLVEWVTAEVILNRPEDPLTFIQDCVAEKLDKRTISGYQPEDFEKYVQDCYDEASSNADESGRIKARSTPRKPSISGDTFAMKERLHLLEKLLESSKTIAQKLDPFEATEAIIHESCALLNCDRASIFTLDKENDGLQLMVAKGANRIFLPMGKGVAGSVAISGKTENISDAYADPRFNSAHDKASGYETKNILAAPVVDGSGSTVGVIQAINHSHKETGASVPFSESDEEVLKILASQSGIALHNAQMYEQRTRSENKVRSLLDVIEAMHSDLGINSLMFTITHRAHSLVEADRCTMFLLDENAKELWSLQGEVNLRIPMDKGIAGECCVSNKIINIPDAYKDPRFNQEIDKKSGYRTNTILCMPCRGANKEVVGVIQLINKREGVFNTEDVAIMNSFLMIAGPVLSQSQLFQRSSQKDDSNEFSGKSIMRQKSKNTMAGAAIIEEGDDDEDEDEDDY